MLFAQRVFQNTSLPLKNARLTPACAGRLDVRALPPDQYSSWPLEMNTLWFSSSEPAAVDVGLGDVADVVAVALEEADHRVLGVERSRDGRRRRVSPSNGRL